MARFTTLISVAELAHLLAGAQPPVVLDAGFDLGDIAAGEKRFAQAHITGANYVHLDRDLCAARTGANGRHPLPDRDAFRSTIGRLGIGPETQVVALDGQGGMYAARLWWMLRWLGHDAVAVLDGGMAAWQAAGGATAAEVVPAPPRGPYPERPSLVASVDAAGVAQRPPQSIVLDARSGERFRGESEPIDPVAGRIPGAVNRFHKANLDAAGRFKPPAVLRDEFRALFGGRAAGEVIHSCGSGVTACHNLLAMTHAGLDGSRLFPGSWSEWSADPARPIARG
ncbi:MAG: sulfurtransferase [Caldimonas sp.]